LKVPLPVYFFRILIKHIPASTCTKTAAEILVTNLHRQTKHREFRKSVGNSKSTVSTGVE
jgi:hypothetical protein